MSDDDLPPSYQPGAPRRRPDPSGARPVGSPPPTPTRRVTRRPSGGSAARAGGAATGAPPPSFTPGAGRPGGAAPTPPGPTPVRQQPTPARQEPAPGRPARPVKRRRRGRTARRLLLLVLVLLLAWPVGLLVWANGRLQHVDALSGAPDTPGRTYLLAGSDSRADGAVADGTDGQRADTIMLLHAPASGPTALISLPRDTYAEIPGHGANKLNAAYSLGGAPLLVETVEGLTGLTMDHYVEIGMGGVQNVVDAVDGIELCLDYDVSDELSGLNWAAGCRTADGPTALAFARMRYSDPEGDIGRANRQRQVVGAIADKVVSPSTLVSPADQVQLIRAGTDALFVDEDTGILDLGRLGLAFTRATGEDGLVGTPPIASFDYRPGGIGSTVLLDPERAPDFFDRFARGELTTADLQTP